MRESDFIIGYFFIAVLIALLAGVYDLRRADAKIKDLEKRCEVAK